eukprot:m.15717 g.15717  ORF g.15717 m.15717 type:complete len:471 (-) comp3305_c0_seq1:240-1652(-)
MSEAGPAAESTSNGSHPRAASDLPIDSSTGPAMDSTSATVSSARAGQAASLPASGTAPPGGARQSKRKPGRAKANKGKKRKKTTVPFRLVGNVKEDHNAKLFSVQFNPYYEQRSDPRYVLATVGGSRVSIYECMPSGAIEVLHVYIDPDPKEEFFTCAWSYVPDTLQPILAVAGSNGVIRQIRPAEFGHGTSLVGHGQAVNELKFHTLDPNLLLSMSADHALRLWNIKTETCVLILGGEKGHRDEVLSADFNLDCTRIVSCGMDHSLKIWNLDTPAIKAAIEGSYKYDRKASKRPFSVRVQHFPEFSTCAVHRNYVDCTRWLGDVLLSKSTDNQIVCWKPGGPPRLDLNEKRALYLGDPVTVLQRFELTKCEIWYLRFTVDRQYKTLAVGNQEGKVFVWDLEARAHSGKGARFVLETKRCTKTVRQVAMTADGSILVAACDDATLWRWDRTASSATSRRMSEASDGEADD